MSESIPWIEVKDRPLVKYNDKGEWECTEDGMKEFIGALQYADKNHPGKELWWIRLCVIEDEIGLCVISEDCNEPAGWTISDITHYFHLPKHP